MKLEDIVGKNLVLTTDQIKEPELLGEIQDKLSALGYYNGSIDKLWGPQSEKAIASFGDEAHLNNEQTGKYGATWAKALLQAKPTPSKFLSQSDYVKAANFLNVEVAAIKAIVHVEAAGGGFFPDGRAKILFEAQHFDQLTDGRYRATHPNISSAYWNRALYYGGPREYERLEQAKALNHDAALMAASWGLGQVMGENYTYCGYSNVSDFANDMQKSEGKQLLAMCGFIKGNGLDRALRNKDFATFARGYNGSGFHVNSYDVKLAKAYATCL